MEKNNLTLNLVLILIILLLVFGVAWIYKSPDKQLVEEDVDNNNAVNTAVAFDYQITAEDHVQGPADAKVTIIEWSDFECPYCAQFNQTMEALLKKYPDDVRWVYKHFPLTSIHPDAQLAAEAAECADEQDKFWEYEAELFADQSSLDEIGLVNKADKIGLDSDRFGQCLDSGKYQDKVNSDYTEGLQYGIKGTPANFINGKFYSGALPFTQLEQIVKSYL